MMRYWLLIVALLFGTSSANAHGMGGHFGGGHFGGHGFFGHGFGGHVPLPKPRPNFEGHDFKHGIHEHEFGHSVRFGRDSHFGHSFRHADFDRDNDAFRSFHAGYGRIHHFDGGRGFGEHNRGFDRSHERNQRRGGDQDDATDFLGIMCPIVSVASFATPYVMPLGLMCMF